MGYEELSLKVFIDEMKEASTGPYVRKFCFIIGAGASRTSGILSGQELVDIWDKQLAERNLKEYLKWKQKYNINDNNKYSFYNHYYEKRYQRTPGDGYNFLDKLMENAKPGSGHVMLANMLTKTDNNTVITTNFDHLIEDAVNYYIQSTPLVLGHKSQAHYVTKKNKRATIVKIHRDLLINRTSINGQAEPLHENWKNAINTIFSEYHPIFIGYAGNDNTLMDFLVDNGEKFSNGEFNCPYWMLYKRDPIGEKVSAFLESADGYVIRHNGFDEVMHCMGTEFGYRLPDKEEFLRNAEKRYEMLYSTLAKVNLDQPELADGQDVVLPELEPEAEPEVIAETEPEIIELEIIQETEPEIIELEIIQETEPEIIELESIQETEPEIVIEMAQDTVTEVETETVSEPTEPEQNNAQLHNHKQGRYEEAANGAQIALELEPDNAYYHHSLGISLHKQGRSHEEVIREMQKAVELEPDNAFYHHSLGISLHKQGRNHVEVIREMQKAVELEPDNARYHNGLGVVLHEQGRYEEAVREMYKAVELEPDNARYHDSLGVSLHEQGRYDEAVNEKQKAVELDPANAGYHGSLGVSLYEQRRYEEAVKEVLKAVEIDPKNAHYHDSLGVSLHRLCRYEQAVEEKQKAVNLEPTNACYHFSLGVSLHKLGRYGEAIEEKQKAVELEPDNPRYHNSLKISLDKLNSSAGSKK